MPINPILLATLLLTDEPQFTELARLGSKLESLLTNFFKSDDTTLVARAVALAGILPDTSLVAKLVKKVVNHDDPEVRMAAVVATEFLPVAVAAKILIKRLDDKDGDVRLMAARMITSAMPQSLRTRLDAIANDTNEDAEFRELCRELSTSPPEPPAEREPIGPTASSLEELDLDVDLIDTSEGDDLIDDGFDEVREDAAISGEFLLFPAVRDDNGEDPEASDL